jgi:hypothetical protein
LDRAWQTHWKKPYEVDPDDRYQSADEFRTRAGVTFQLNQLHPSALLGHFHLHRISPKALQSTMTMAVKSAKTNASK